MLYKFFNITIINKTKLLNFNFKNINIFNKNKFLFKYYYKKNIFYRLDLFLNKLNINKIIFFNISLNYYKNYYDLFNSIVLSKNYYYFLHKTLIKYINLIFSKKNKYFIINKNYIYLPNNFLNNIKIQVTNIELYTKTYINTFNFNLNNLNKKIKLDNNNKSIKLFLQNKYNLNQIWNREKNFSFSYFILKFLRIQRRYNKRRYSKVRVSSRNSFFAGISLSSIFLGLLWGGSIKNIDWYTSKLIIVDINFFLFILFFYFSYRIYILNYPSIFIRKKNKIKIITSLQNLFLFNIWFKK